MLIDLSRMLQRVIGAQASLELDLSPILPIVRGDRSQTEQVITSLVVNARDAMSSGGIVRIATDMFYMGVDRQTGRGDVPPGHYARLTVADTGAGLDAETVAHLFEPFFTTKEMGHGTGLGLATVYGTVRQSGGYLTVHSVPGQGTQFNIYFPACTDGAGEAPAIAGPASATTTGTTILVVEDEPMVPTTDGHRAPPGRLHRARGHERA